jgi:hypothetical protein
MIRKGERGTGAAKQAAVLYSNRFLKKWLFAVQDIFSDNASVRSAEKSQIFRALRSPRVIRGKNMIRAQSPCRSF